VTDQKKHVSETSALHHVWEEISEESSGRKFIKEESGK